MCLRKRRKNPQQGYDLKDESVPSADPSNVGSNQTSQWKSDFQEAVLKETGKQKKVQECQTTPELSCKSLAIGIID